VRRDFTSLVFIWPISYQTINAQNPQAAAPGAAGGVKRYHKECVIS
jgi:hypothetical protein